MLVNDWSRSVISLFSFTVFHSLSAIISHRCTEEKKPPWLAFYFCSLQHVAFDIFLPVNQMKVDIGNVYVYQFFYWFACILYAQRYSMYEWNWNWKHFSETHYLWSVWCFTRSIGSCCYFCTSFPLQMLLFKAPHTRRYWMRSIKKSPAHQQIKHGKCPLLISSLAR